MSPQGRGRRWGGLPIAASAVKLANKHPGSWLVRCLANGGVVGQRFPISEFHWCDASDKRLFMTASPALAGTPWNVPNLLTSARLVLALAVIALIHFHLFFPALIIFLIAASTDWMDGYWARKYGQVTKLGRIFDPFVDKIIICGSFIALVAIPQSGIVAWMAIVVVARELLVTSLRGIIEGAGGDFSATTIGKWKMVFQCVAVVASLLYLTSTPPPEWLQWTHWASIWLAVGLTVYSGFDYVMTASRVMRGSEGVAG